MSKLNNAPIIGGKPTSFFTQKRNLQESIEKKEFTLEVPIVNKERKKKGRPVTQNENKKEIKLSLSLSKRQRDELVRGLENYNNSKKHDVFFKPISMNEFIETLLASSEELKKLL